MRPEKLDEAQLRQTSAIILAYVGDAVFELMVRTHLVAMGPRKVRDIHLDTVDKVKAESQARIIQELLPELSEEEKDVYLRGRNAKATPPKHALIGDYRMSTGFEALIGYLYLKGDQGRLMYIIQRALHA